MAGFLREHTGSIAISVGLHGVLAVALTLMTYVSPERHATSAQPLPIDAVVVDSRALRAAQRSVTDRADQEAAQARSAADAKAAADARAAAEAQAVADAKAAADAKAQSDAKAASERQAAAATRAAEQVTAQAAAAARQKSAAESQAATARAAQDLKIQQARQAIVDANRAAEARKAAEARQAEEARQAAQAKAAADAQAAADARRAADDRAKRDREAELRRQLAEEEHVSAVEASPLRDRYIAMLRNKIQSAWIKPPSATAGIDCVVEVTQVPGGEVTGARVTQCNGDAAVRQSIENAVYRATPLPDPPDPALFERNLSLRFRPNE